MLGQELFGRDLCRLSPAHSARHRTMSRSPLPHLPSDHSSSSYSPGSVPRQPIAPCAGRRPLGSPCPAVPSWPAPPVNPRSELKPTAIAALLPGHSPPPPSAHSPPPPSAHSPISPVIPLAVSSLPSPLPRLELPHEDSVRLLSVLRAVTAGSVPPGGSSPSGSWSRETELRQKIQALEEIVAEYERQKFNVLGTFSDFRERVTERERRLEADYSTRIINLSEEVLGAKKDFEERMKSFQLLQEQFEREKEQALEKLRRDHQLEIQALEQRFSESQLLNLEQKYMIEIQRLEEERKALKTERERLNENFEVKLRRAESLFETELIAAKMLYNRELQALREHEEALKDELAARQEEFKERMAEMQHQSRQTKDDLCHCREEVVKLERKLDQKAAEIERLAKELAIARRVTEQTVRELGQVQLEAEKGQRTVEEQRRELEQRASQLSEAEETRAGLEQTVRELRLEVKGFRNRVDLLEVERDGLRAQAESQQAGMTQLLTVLETMLESVTREKEGCQQKYEQMLEAERTQAKESEAALRQEFSAKLGVLEEQYNGLREHMEKESEHLGPENEKLWDEIESLRAEKRELERKQGEREAGMSQLSGAINTVERNAGMGGREADEEKEEEGEGRKETVQLEELLARLKEVSRSVEGIVREKEQTKARLEQLGKDTGAEKLLARMTELERELDEQNDRAEEAVRAKEEMENEIKRLKKTLERTDEERRAMEELASERARAKQLQTELEKAEQELDRARASAEREIRELEEEHSLALEKKIGTLNREHERTVELMQQREQEMADQLARLQMVRNRDEEEMEREEQRAEESTQTEKEGEGDGEDGGEEEQRAEEDGGEEDLGAELDRLREREKAMEELVRRLQSELAETQRDRPRKEARSQSIASAAEHLVLCQKVAARSTPLADEHGQRKECQQAAVGRLEATVPPEMSPPQPGPSSQRFQLSPSGSRTQRASPSRQLFFAAKSPSSSTEAKRPAWKF